MDERDGPRVMSTSEVEWNQLRKLMYAAHLGGFLERERDFVSQRLEAFAQAYARRVTGAGSTTGLPSSVGITSLFEEHQKHPHRPKVLLQAVAFGCTPEILAMVWAVLQRAKIKHLAFGYERWQSSQLTCEVIFPDGSLHVFTGQDHWDTAVLRFAGLSKADGAPVIEGFYPLHVPRRPSDSPLLRIMPVLEWVRDLGGTLPVCPSLIDSERVREIADDIVDGVKNGWVEPAPGSVLAAVRSDDAAEAEARALLAQDAAVVLRLTMEGGRALRRGHVYRQLRSASTDSLLKLRAEIERVLAMPGVDRTPDELEEIRDELAVILELLHEAGLGET